MLRNLEGLVLVLVILLVMSIGACHSAVAPECYTQHWQRVGGADTVVVSCMIE